jgi:hypothetical protein
MKRNTQNIFIFVACIVSVTILLNLFAWTISGQSLFGISDIQGDPTRAIMQVLFYVVGILSPLMLVSIFDN